MRKISIIIITLCILFTSTAFAADSKSNVAVLLCNNLNYRSPDTNAKLGAQLMDKFTTKFAPSYNLITDDKYKNQLSSIGLTDLTTAERGDIIPVFKADGVNYIVIFDLLPKVEKYSEWNLNKVTSTLYLKVIDVDNNRTLYNGKLTYTSRMLKPSHHIDNLWLQTEDALLKSLPK